MPFPLRVVTLNVNGIRSAVARGFLDWLETSGADVVCLQELRAQVADLPVALGEATGWSAHWCPAERRGYSGVALLARRAPDEVRHGFGVAEFDLEGRCIEARFGALSVLSVYFPSGSSGEARQEAKYRFLDAFLPHLRSLGEAGRELLVCGDWNIAHTERDLANWRGNRRNSGFLPEERAWLDRVYGELGLVDVWRRLHPDGTGEGYTWWSNRGAAWAKNVGWRIDLQVATPAVAALAQETRVHRESRYSDHAPLIVDYGAGPEDSRPHGV